MYWVPLLPACETMPQGKLQGQSPSAVKPPDDQLSRSCPAAASRLLQLMSLLLSNSLFPRLSFSTSLSFSAGLCGHLPQGCLVVTVACQLFPEHLAALQVPADLSKALLMRSSHTC